MVVKLKVKIANAIFNRKPKQVFFIVTNTAVYQPIGYCYLDVKGQEGYLKALWVDEEYRRKKIATRLIKRVRKYAKKIGCTNFLVDTHPHNEATKSLFRKMGYMELTKFQRSLN